MGSGHLITNTRVSNSCHHLRPFQLISLTTILLQTLHSFPYTPFHSLSHKKQPQHISIHHLLSLKHNTHESIQRTKDDKKTRLRQNVETKKSRKNNVQLSECTLSFFRMLSSYPDVYNSSSVASSRGAREAKYVCG